MKPVGEQTLYEVLEVPFDAPENEIVRAWERAEALYGPGSLSTYTLISPDEAAIMGARLEEALNVLLDPVERGRYDALLHPGPAEHAPGDGQGAWPRPEAVSLPPIIPPLAVSPSEAAALDKLLSHPMAEGAPSARPFIIARPFMTMIEAAPPSEESDPAEGSEDVSPSSIATGNGVAAASPLAPPSTRNGVCAVKADAACAPDEPSSGPEEESTRACGNGVEEESAEGPAAPTATVPEGADRPDTSPILLSEVAAEPLQPIPLATPAPISPPFAALLESPAALAVSPLARSVSQSEAPEPQGVQEIAPADRELLVPEGAPFTGEVLRRARAARGLTVQQICERTKISRHHIEHLEADRHEKLPAPVYLRGILMALAKELRLDGQKVARSYLEAVASQAPAKAR